MYIVAFNGSPRRKGNTTLLLHEFMRGAQEAGADTEELIAEELQLKYCRGCLRCNVLKRCSITADDWGAVSQKIVRADVLVFASPIYFHHLTASLKKVIDRFRSFIHVQITENGLRHTPWQQWKKQFVLLLCLGSPVADDAQPVIDLFSFLAQELGHDNSLTTIIGTGLAVVNQVQMNREQLEALYNELQLPVNLAEPHYFRNKYLLEKCYSRGRELGAGKSIK
jgi:NAD(P)H-dependent FMN reductase